MPFTPGKDSHCPGIIGCIWDAWWTQPRAASLSRQVRAASIAKTYPPRTGPVFPGSSLIFEVFS